MAKLVVCNPRKNALLKDGNKSDRIDAHKLAELLYLNKLSSVYHGETGLPPKLEDVINKALEKDRNLRYQVAAEMRSDLLRGEE